MPLLEHLGWCVVQFSHVCGVAHADSCTVVGRQKAMSKTWKRVAIEAVATTRVRGAPDKGEVGFERGAELELYSERRGWYKGYVLPERKHGIIPGKAIHITVEHDTLDIEPPADDEEQEEQAAAPVKASPAKKPVAVAKKPAPAADFDDLLDELGDDEPPPPVVKKVASKVAPAPTNKSPVKPPPPVVRECTIV